MGKLPNVSQGHSILHHVINEKIVSKEKDLDFELPSETIFPSHYDKGTSSSGTNLRSLFIGMGFLPPLVDKVLKGKGEDLGEGSVNLLLETLIEHSGQRRRKSESSDSLDRLFDDDDDDDDDDDTCSKVLKPQIKEENGWSSTVSNQKRASLRMMNFSESEIEFAMNRLGENAEIDEIVDYIVSAQISERFTDKISRSKSCERKGEDASNETLFRTMEKTLRLLEMGFTENEISTAFERFGADASITELADSIFDIRCGDRDKDYKYSSAGPVKVKVQNFSGNTSIQSSLIRLGETHKGKRTKEEHSYDHLDSVSHCSLNNSRAGYKGKKPRQKLFDDCSACTMPFFAEEEAENKSTVMRKEIFQPSSSPWINQVIAKPPYFLYGSMVNIPQDWWSKISQFLYTQVPEFVSSQFFSAISRKEGYVHNLPTENRFHILPKPPMTIEEAIPYTKKWWPSWDTRKQLSCTISKTDGSSQLCECLARILSGSRGLPSLEQQKDILHHCQKLNLVWVGPGKLGPIEPEHLESILGYPLNHTQAGGSSLNERLHTLKHCFQTDTLGYHLSVLKHLFPGGLNMLSIFTGAGGAEVALHRLGVPLKAVVSVENSETKRKIVRRWWEKSGQTGDLVQIEDIQRLSTSRLEGLIKKFEGFDLVICQNPCILTSNSKMAAQGDFPGFDFSLFYEFVRVVQRVRSSMERKRR